MIVHYVPTFFAFELLCPNPASVEKVEVSHCEETNVFVFRVTIIWVWKGFGNFSEISERGKERERVLVEPMLTTFFAFELLSPKTLHWKKEVPHCEESLLFLSFQVVVCFSGYNNF